MVTTASSRTPAKTMERRYRRAGLSVGALAAFMATASLLGPLVLNAMTYRTSATTLHQLVGGDAAVLFVVAPPTSW